MAIDIDYLSKSYFYFDEPVEYKLKDGNNIIIKPINVKQAEIFLSSVDILMIDKNASSSPEVIRMSYLQFILTLFGANDIWRAKFVNILELCLCIHYPRILSVDEKPVLTDDKNSIKITRKDFEDIRRIILYQNIIHFDDEYVNPEFKQAMAEVDALKNKNIEIPSLERKMAIITAHCGIPKKEQMEMTYRSHSLLFEEVCGEVDYVTTRPIALYGGEADKVQWMFKKKRGKFDGYYTVDRDYHKQMGGDGNIAPTFSNNGSNLMQQFDSFKQQ